MLHRLVTYQVRKDSLPQALALARAFVDEVGRKEGGTASYKAWQDAEEPTRFLHFASFRTPSAEEYHRKTQWHKKFHDALQPLCSQAPRTMPLTPVDAE